MLAIILMVTLWIVIGSFYFANMLAIIQPKKNIVLGVSLPDEAFSDEAYQHWLADYKRIGRKKMLILLALSTSLLLTIYFPVLADYFSIGMVCFWTLFFCAFFYLARTIDYYRQRLLRLKNERQWQYGGHQSVSYADIGLARQKNEKTVGWLWFGLPLGLIMLVYLIHPQRQTTGMAIQLISHSLSVLLILVVHVYYLRTKGAVISEDSQQNVSYNQTLRQIWSQTSFWLAMYVTIQFAIVSFFYQPIFFRSDGHWLLLGAIGLLMIIPILVILRTWQRIRRLENGTKRQAEVAVSQDDFYRVHPIWGLVYANPYEQSTFVQVEGMGYNQLTVNLGTRNGHFVQKTVNLLLLVTILGVGIVLPVAEDMVAPQMTVTNEEVWIDSLFGRQTLQLKDIEAVNLRHQELKEAYYKNNGSATRRYRRGEFYSDEYGSTSLYIFNGRLPYLVIRSAERTYLFNDRQPEKTQDLFNQLTKQCK